MQRLGNKEPPLKLCSKCGEGEALFPKGSPAWCRPCKLAYNREWRANNKDKVAAQAIRYKESGKKNTAQRARRYGMSVAELNKFLEDNPNCAICGIPGEHIDHCHSTGRVRGHLCNGCNKGLGHFKDSVESLLNAVNYLKE